MGGALKFDPAVERFDRMREEAYKHYRFTRRTTVSAVVGVVVFPALIYYMANQTDARWSWVAKSKSDSLARKAPEPATE